MKERFKRIHILGVGGVGVGALAGLLKESGLQVSGSERGKIYPPMRDLLEELDIHVFEGYRPENLAEVQPDLVIIGNVIRRDNPEAQAVLAKKLPYLSMPEALKYFFFKGKKGLVVAGTHGKTTTSALLAYALERLGKDPTYLIGGLLRDRGRNFALGQGPFVVLEGDEYDSAFFDKRAKFFHYAPFGAILTSVEFDHADIYRDLASLKGVFKDFVRLIPPKGLLIYAADDPRAREVARDALCPTLSYGLGSEAQIRLLKRSVSSRGQDLYISFEGQTFRFFIPLIGSHNALNALAVWGLLRGLGFAPQDIAQAVKDFPGTKRRQECLYQDEIVILDDFAHHPTAVRVTIEAAKEAFCPQRLVACFEPRTNTSRRRIFQEEYSQALSHADLVILKAPPDLDKVPEKDRLDLQKLTQSLNSLGVEAYAFSKAEEVLQTLTKILKPGDLVLFMSNGPFDHLPQKLRQIWSQNERSKRDR